jgi:glycosyltransferase involved in cell wall biosynthesis
MAFIGRVYDIEADARAQKRLGAELLAHRQAHAGPVVAAFRTWLDAHITDLLPSNPVRKAMQYYINHWAALTHFLNDPLVPLDNNWSERALRKVAMVRNNSMFAGGVRRLWKALRHDTPMVLTEHGVYMREQNLFLSRFRSLLFSKRFLLNLINAVSRANYWFADVVAPVCRYNTRWELAHGTDPSKIEVIYNGVDAEMFSPGARPAGPPHVIATARIDPLKDIDGISILYLDAMDVIRHRLVKDIIRAYTEAGGESEGD